MMNKNLFYLYRFISFWLVLLFFISASTAQNTSNCSQRLNIAEELFANGKLELIPDTLANCMKSKDAFATKEERERALHLLLTAYAIEAQPPADSIFQKLVDEFPEHLIDLDQKVDPAELTYIYDFHRTWPSLYLGAQVGVNTSLIFPQFPGYALDNTHEQNADTEFYTTRQGVHAGIYADIPITPRSLRVSVGIYYSEIKYDSEDSLQTISTPSTANFAKLEFRETQKWLSVPVMVSYHFDRRSRYNFQKKKIYPYVSVGISVNTLLQAKLSDLRRTNAGIESQTGINTTEGKFAKGVITELRNSLNVSAIGAIGLQYKFGLDYITFQLRYEQFLRNVVNPTNRYNIPELVYRYGHVDNNFFQGNAAITVGYNMTIYQPKKLKAPRHRP